MRKRALLLGVKDYEAPITQVTSAQNDLDALKYKLNQLSFEVVTYFNCKYDNITNSVDRFYEEAPTDSIDQWVSGYKSEEIQFCDLNPS